MIITSFKHQIFVSILNAIPVLPEISLVMFLFFLFNKFCERLSLDFFII